MTVKKLYNTALLGTDAEFIKQVTALFVQHTPAFCEGLVSGFADKNWHQVYFNAHKMKASIDLFAIDDLKEIIRKVEKNSKEEMDVPEMQAMVKKIDETITACIAAMKTDFEL